MTGWRSRPSRRPESERLCSFCGKPSRVVRRIIVMRDHAICDACVVALISDFAKVLPPGSGAVCVGCGKGERRRRLLRRDRQVPMFRHSSGLAICAECLQLAGEILEAHGIRV